MCDKVANCIVEKKICTNCHYNIVPAHACKLYSTSENFYGLRVISLKIGLPRSVCFAAIPGCRHSNTLNMPGRMNHRLSQTPRLSIVVMAGHESEERKPTIRDYICNHVKTIVTLVMIFGTIFCIVMIIMAHKWSFEAERREHVHACLDVAVIGAGVSGSYAAWRLRERGLKVHIFEASDRVGGRLYTKRPPGMPGVKFEYGATHYTPSLHRLLNHTIHVLKLPHREFPPLNLDQPIFYLRGDLFPMKEITRNSIPYVLNIDEGQKTPQELTRYYITKSMANGTYWVDRPLTITTKDGLPFYEQGFKNLLDKVATQEGVNLLSDTSTWRSFVSNENAALLASVANAESSVTSGHMTLFDGMDSLPNELVKQFLNASESHDLRKNMRLSCIQEDGRLYRLVFIKTQTTDDETSDIRDSELVCAKKVVVAIPHAKLKDLEWETGESIPSYRQMIKSVEDIPALTAYFVYNHTWWVGLNPNPGNVITDLPVRNVQYFGKFKDENENDLHLFQVTRNDYTDVDYFRGLLERQYFDGEHQYICNDKDNFINDVHTQLSRIYNVPVSNIHAPSYVYIKDWTNSPSGAGWSLWKRGVKWDSVADMMIRPAKGERVFIVGDSFCGGGCQVSAEGALQTVDNMLRRYF